jgi:hypothetical protein
MVTGHLLPLAVRARGYRSMDVMLQRFRSNAWQHDRHHGRRTTMSLVCLTQNSALL